MWPQERKPETFKIPRFYLQPEHGVSIWFTVFDQMCYDSLVWSLMYGRDSEGDFNSYWWINYIEQPTEEWYDSFEYDGEADMTDDTTTVVPTGAPQLADFVLCDFNQCVARSLVEVSRDCNGVTRQLTFCGHHYRAKEVHLAVEGWTVTADSREYRG